MLSERIEPGFVDPAFAKGAAGPGGLPILGGDEALKNFPAAVVLLVAVTRRLAARVLPLIDIVAFGAATVLIVAAVSLAPLWGTAFAVTQ